MRHTTRKSEKVLLKGAKQKNKTGENKIMRESSWHLLRSIKGTESFSISFHFLLKNKRENTLSVIDCLLVLVVPMRKTSPMIPSLKRENVRVVCRPLLLCNAARESNSSSPTSLLRQSDWVAIFPYYTIRMEKKSRLIKKKNRKQNSGV